MTNCSALSQGSQSVLQVKSGGGLSRIRIWAICILSEPSPSLDHVAFRQGVEVSLHLFKHNIESRRFPSIFRQRNRNFGVTQHVEYLADAGSIAASVVAIEASHNRADG